MKLIEVYSRGFVRTVPGHTLDPEQVEEELKVSCRGQRHLIEINENDDGEILASLDAE